MSQGFNQPMRGLISQADSQLIESARVPRSTFRNQWTRKTAFDAGFLIPILVDPIYPGDHMEYKVTAYLRMATPLFPMFDMQRVDTHFFFVPNRLVWDSWKKFMGEQRTVGASIAFLVPRVDLTYGGDPVGSIYDHMGLPVLGQMTYQHLVNALPFRAYNLIYNEWFRDENTGVPATESKADADDTNSWYNLLPRAKSHDYFTSALPWPQKFTAPTIPLGGLAPVRGIGAENQVYASGTQAVYETAGTGAVNYTTFAGPIDASNKRMWIKGTATAGGYPEIYADLSATSGIDINTLRQAWLVQSLLERDARGGTRYVEQIKSHFDVISPDFRLARPEYIGGGQSPLNITPIAQTAPTAGVPLGAIGGAGTSAGQHRASFAATEHGYIIGLISVRSELSYQQGIAKHFKAQTRYDYYTPELAGLGEQAILNYELYADGNAVIDFQVFGYQERWQELRTRQSEVTGIMRSTAAGTLDGWHLAQKFTGPPVLNNAFINDIPPMTRVLAAAGASTGQQYLADIMFQRTATRPLPTYGTPVSLGRF